MADSIFREQFDDQEIIASLERIEKGLVDIGKEADAAGKEMKQAFSDVETSKGVVDALKDIQKEYKDLKGHADVLKSALRSATDPKVIDLYTKSIVELERGMNTLEKAAKKAGISLKESKDQAGTGKQVFENFFGAFTKVAIITAALSAVKDFVVGAVKLSEQVNSAKRSFEAFTGSAVEAEKIVNNLIATGQKNFIPTDDILSAGKALLAFGENAGELDSVLSRIADISAATGKNFNELTTIYGKARAAGVLYAEDINQLVDAGIPIIQEFAKQMGVSNDQVKKLASEGKISFEELQLAMFNLTAEGGKFADQAQTQSDSIAGAWNRLVSVVQPAIEFIGGLVSELVQGVLNALSFVAEAIGDLFSSENNPKIEVDYTGRDAYEQAKEDLQERERLENEARKSRQRANKEENEKRAAEAKKAADKAAALERERQQAILAGMQDGVAKQIAAENYRYSELIKQLKKFHLDTTEAEAQHQTNLLNIQLDEIERLAEKQRQLEELREAQDDYNRAQLADKSKQVERERDLSDQEIDIAEEQFKGFIELLKANGTDKKLIAEKQFEFDKLVEQKRLENELRAQQALLALTDAGDTNRIAALNNSIALIKAKIDTLANTAQEGDGTGKKGIWALLGVEDETGQDRFKKAVSTILDSLNQLAEARVREARAAVEAAEEKVRAAESALNEEKKIAEDGHANNVSIRQLELTDAKKARDQALKEESKAKRAQILLDSVGQVSSLVSASADIFKSFAKIPIVGVPLAIAAIGLMFGTFAKVKADALKAASVPKLRKGAKIEGRTHEEGGELRELERGEQVVGAAESRGNDRFFEDMRRGKYKGVDLHEALGNARSDSYSPLAASSSRTSRMLAQIEAANEHTRHMVITKTIEAVGEKVAAAINRKPDIYPWKDGYKVVEQSGIVKTIKNVQPIE